MTVYMVMEQHHWLMTSDFVRINIGAENVQYSVARQMFLETSRGVGVRLYFVQGVYVMERMHVSSIFFSILLS